jgi:hypothetical protein
VQGKTESFLSAKTSLVNSSDAFREFPECELLKSIYLRRRERRKAIERLERSELPTPIVEHGTTETFLGFENPMKISVPITVFETIGTIGTERSGGTFGTASASTPLDLPAEG